MRQVDYIIVGAGSAGSVLADRLSACGAHQVLVLEAGGSDRHPWVRLPIGYGKTFHDAAVNWRFETEAEGALAGRRLYWPRGKVLGGSSSINAMVYHRGLPGDFDDWAAAGNPGWGWEDVAPVFARSERRIAADGSVSGEGSLSVADRSGEHHPVKRHYIAAAAELGFEEAEPGIAPWAEGIAPYHLTTRAGLRCSAADAFLRPAMRRRNLTVETRASVTRIVFEARRAVGVSYRRRGMTAEVHARRGVILAAGAVKSPQLLQLSGVGPGGLLSRLGVGVVHANRNVGGGLQDHLGITYLYRATEPTLNQSLGTLAGKAAAALAYALRRGGPLSLSVNQMGGMLRSEPGLNRADQQLYFNPLSYSTSYRNKRPLLRPDPWPGFAIGFNPCRPTSRGRIEAARPDAEAAPLIVPNYLSTPEDEAGAVAGARLVRRLLGTAAMGKLIDGPNGFDLRGEHDDDVLLEDFRERSGTVFHPCGTCRMAPEDQGGVVDPGLRVYGTEGLRVVDASVFPNITSANTNAPTIMVAQRAADMILAEARG